ncbi:tricarboxylic transporter [Janibacter melonis]|uniref:Tricarboxylic transporter n=1 Tax=Janibacter melonis TaxID=262209 RepID=A0A176QGJ1_9MICO|nr:tripartite tricarboxylate transporter substrate-binding protein [Janibacter melonis]OAB88824.1 tricarboxylic transporter [Janibacter melonis]
MSRRRALSRAALVAAVAVAFTAAATDAHSNRDGSGTRNSLTILVPSAPGGTWDTNARELQRAMKENDVVANPQVVNLPGGAGTLGLSQLVQTDGREDIIMMTGTVMLGGVVVNDAPDEVSDTTPIARLVQDYQAVFVPGDSPFDSLDDLVEAWKKSPGGTAIGGGALGGTDSVIAHALAEEVGIDPTSVNYIPYAGGGEVLPALLSHSVDAAIGGYAEFEDQVEAGKLKALALTAPEPQEGIDVKTFIEQDVDLYVPNWQGVVAAPGISQEAEDSLGEVIAETVKTPEWRDALQRNRWTDVYQPADEFTPFIDSESDRIRDVIVESGIAN